MVCPRRVSSCMVGSPQTNPSQGGNVMELKNYVSDVLVQICEGIADAQMRTKEIGAVISPRHQLGVDSIPCLVPENSKSDAASIVKFDVAMAVDSSNSSEKGHKPSASIQVASFSLSLTGKQQKAQENQGASHLSRVQFEIVVKWPEVSGELALNPLKTSVPLGIQSPADQHGGY